MHSNGFAVLATKSLLPMIHAFLRSCLVMEASLEHCNFHLLFRLIPLHWGNVRTMLRPGLFPTVTRGFPSSSASRLDYVLGATGALDEIYVKGSGSRVGV